MSGRFLALIGAHNSLGPEVPQLLSDFIRAMATVWTMATVATVTMFSRVHSRILLRYEAAGLAEDHFTRSCSLGPAPRKPRRTHSSNGTPCGQPARPWRTGSATTGAQGVPFSIELLALGAVAFSTRRQPLGNIWDSRSASSAARTLVFAQVLR